MASSNVGGGLATSSSILSTESPAFNPRGITSSTATSTMGSQSPIPKSGSNNNRSGAASPTSSSNAGSGSSSGELFSNAIAKHTFQYDK